jgi:hypothetical protein
VSFRHPATIVLALLLGACTGTPEGDKEPVDDSGDHTPDDHGTLDADNDGYITDDDCDDDNPDAHPGATEVCDAVDNDCDDEIDEAGATGEATWYADADGDTFGDEQVSTTACAQPDDYVADATDCDDADLANFPGNAEVCDGGDNDCDAEIDEDPVDAGTWYADADGDTFGDAGTSVVSCTAGEGWVADATDCDDGNDQIYTGAPEACDGVDHDCDDATYEDTSADAPTWYGDVDGDGYGDATLTATACEAPEGYVAEGTDCDDEDLATFPGALETCDDADEDCDGVVDDDAIDAVDWYADVDGDGYGDRAVSATACDAPVGYVADRTDCDDTDAALSTDCGGAGGAFDGTFGSEWETLASSMDSPWALQSYHPSGTLLYNMFSSPGSAYDPDADAWSRLVTPADYTRIWNAMAPFEDQLYSISNSHVYRYTPADDAWETLTAIAGSDDYNMTESDEDGNIYGHTSDGNIVIYDAVGGGLTYVSTPFGSQYETRMGYDPTGPALYFGGFGTPNLYRYDIASGDVTEVEPIPEDQLNDIFCSDRSGHIYAAGGSSGTTLWQYTTATDEWAPIPDLPSDHGNNSHCTVSEDGWLYVGTDASSFYRLELY